MITGPPHDPHFHCAIFGLLLAVGSFSLGQSKLWAKLLREHNAIRLIVEQNAKNRSDTNRNV
jgi:hypothetical protein